ncbi:cupin domain-containing protein [Spirillospora sp. NPDC048911]|uniref:cupin domain-containing protein n=1 Tax=Spirillospora sp. NPDC048911 TaxID=3364527 RepID=UPI003716F5C7
MVNTVNTFPGGVGVSGLSVYDWPTADGLCGGSPHVHLACAEAYVVVGGTGRVQTLTRSGSVEIPLEAGTVAWFTPGTIHRLVNDDGALRIVVIMQNGGLPEAGDAVFTFPAATLADAEAYDRAAALADGTHVHAAGEDAARRRRDLAIEGFLELRRATEAGDTSALEEFYRAAVRLKADRFAEWEERWRSGALTAAEATGAQLTALRHGDGSHLERAAVHLAPDPAGDRLGMCGRLDVYDLAGDR